MARKKQAETKRPIETYEHKGNFSALREQARREGRQVVDDRGIESLKVMEVESWRLRK